MRVEIKGQLVVVASLYHVGLGAPTWVVRLGQVLSLLPVVCVYRGRGKWEVIQKLGVPLHYEWFHLPLVNDRGNKYISFLPQLDRSRTALSLS